MQPVTAEPLERLFEGVPVQIRGNPESIVSSIATDSRHVRPGALFFALPGARADGHDFAAAAAAAGAAGIVAQREVHVPEGTPVVIVPDTLAALSKVAARFYEDPSRDLVMVGVTGTNGKTTTTFFIEAIARAAGQQFGVIGTLGARLGAQPVEQLENTTPFAHDLQRILAEFRDAGGRGAVLEVSSHALQLHRVDDVAFDVAVLTNLTQDHLDFHKTFDDYRASKRKLFAREAGKGGKPPVAVLNANDAEGRELAHKLERRLTYGIENPDALLNATEVSMGATGSRFAVRSLRPAPFLIRLPGAFNVSNAMAGLTAACALDFDVEAIAEGLESVTEVPGRMISIPAGEIGVYIDYAHTPDGMEQILHATRALTRGRLFCVFGCGGNRDALKRPRMGRIAQELSDYVILTTDNPRHEDPHAIVAGILSGMNAEKVPVETITDRAAAIAHAIELAQPGDSVVIAGKGHEDYQIFGDERRPFSDASAARAAIEQIKR
jgi:UDP-N-acetylmuramoyl-L-alanyl-D-glutamate--2,6-diaminopimelate ligase